MTAMQSDTVAQGFGYWLMIRAVDAHGKTTAEAAHGTVTRHYRAHQRGEETLPIPLPPFSRGRAASPSALNWIKMEHWPIFQRRWKKPALKLSNAVR